MKMKSMFSFSLHDRNVLDEDQASKLTMEFVSNEFVTEFENIRAL